MADQEASRHIPWMCAVVVLSVELWVKGPLMAAAVGASSLALLFFIVAAIRYLTTDITTPGISELSKEAQASETLSDAPKLCDVTFFEFNVNFDAG